MAIKSIIGAICTCTKVLVFVFFASIVILVNTSHAGSGEIDSDGTVDFEFNFRFPPTDADIVRAKSQIQSASQIICDATDGQVRFENVRLTGGAADEDKAAYWWFAEQFRTAVSFSLDGSALGTPGSHVNVGQGGIRGDILAHEFGHLGFGLGDQYDEQRRFGGPCGLGPGFEAGTTNEINHSIMQQTGYQMCVGPGTSVFNPSAGVFPAACETNAWCPSSDVCQPVIMSELSVATNHDPVLGDNVLCPLPRPTNGIKITARLNRADPTDTFDNTDFTTAEATSQLVRDIEVIDSKGELTNFFEGTSAHRLKIFFEHAATNTWSVHFGMDDGDFDMGTAGDLRILLSVDLAFDPATGGLDSITPTNPVISITGLANGADDLSLAVDLGMTGPPTGAGLFEDSDTSWFLPPTVQLGGLPKCTSGDCSERWNTGSDRYESTQQSLIHNGDSDWKTLKDNYDFITQPAGLPTQTMPASCLNAVNFVEDVVGTDQVMLIMDRSGSMDDPVSEGSDQTRLDFAKAAARAYVDLFAGRGGDLAILSFDEFSRFDRYFEGGTETFDGSETAGVKTDKINTLSAGGKTGIGTALTNSLNEFKRVLTEGRTRTAFLLSDGENNRGEDPKDAAQRLKDQNIRVFTIPVGQAADRDLLSEVAGETDAVMLDAPSGIELPPIYAELFARFRGEALTLPRTESAVQGETIIIQSPAPEGSLWARLKQQLNILVSSIMTMAVADPVIPPVEVFSIPVEGGAERLNVMLSARNLDVTTWDPGFRLIAPDGTIIDEFDTSGRVRFDPFYRIIQVIAPIRGEWQLEVSAKTTQLEFSFVLAHVENGLPDCFTAARPLLAGPADTIRITANASFLTDVETVNYSGIVKRPDGSLVPLSFSENPLTGVVSADFSAYVGRGIYEAIVTCRVPDGAQLRKGEVIFDGPDRPDLVVESFQRTSRTSFYLASSTLPPCANPDCDGDGIPNTDEGTGDTDGDNLPDERDDDADGDDIPDAIEGVVDTDGDGMRDFQDIDSDNDGILDDDEGAGDTDGDGTPDFRDLDSDNDGIPDVEEGSNDTDGDGIPNFRDLDSDGDGIPDVDDPFPFNTPPDCSNAQAVPGLYWSPNHSNRSLQQVFVTGIVDADDGAISLTIESIDQDEPVIGKGSGKTCPDAAGVGSDNAQIRVERSGRGDGRVYHIGVLATDEAGESCRASVQVCIPHDQSAKSCIDQGPVFSSTGACS